MMRGSGELLPRIRAGQRVRVRMGELRHPATVTHFQLAPTLPGGWRFEAKLDSGLRAQDLTLEDLEAEAAQ